MIKQKIILFILFILNTVFLFSQEIYDINKINDTSDYPIDSIFCYLNKIDTQYVKIKIINNTPDTYYLFSTYLTNNYITNTYLHRIDSSKKTYKLSFAPLIPYLTCEECETANYIDGEKEEKILSPTRNKIEFIELKAHHEFIFSLKAQNILTRSVVVNFDIKKYKDYTRTALIQSKRTFDNFKYYDVIIEFALYKTIKEIKEYKNVKIFQNTTVNNALKEYIKVFCSFKALTDFPAPESIPQNTCGNNSKDK
jgi:hypothetical protein